MTITKIKVVQQLDDGRTITLGEFDLRGIHSSLSQPAEPLTADDVAAAAQGVSEPTHSLHKPVRVVSVKETIFKRHRPPFGLAKPVTVEQEFRSPRAAAEWLGAPSNYLSLMFTYARKRLRVAPNGGAMPEPLRAVVYGVAFEYINKEDEVGRG